MNSYENNPDISTLTSGNEKKECFQQLVKVTRHNNKDVLQLNTVTLESVLKTTKGRPLVILSVVDNHNSKNSVLLNCIKKSLKSLQNEDSDSTTPFFASDFNASEEPGIWIWSKAFILNKDDTDIAVVLMHFHQSKNLSCTIYTDLAILLSSAVFYNVNANQVENALDSLQPIFKYGHLCLKNGSELLDEQKPFQSLCFIFHNLSKPFENNNNAKCRTPYLQNIVESLDPSKYEATQNGINCFQEVMEFLEDQNTHPKIELNSYLDQLLENGDIVARKQILGKGVTSSEFTHYFQEYISMFEKSHLNAEEMVTEVDLWNSTCGAYHNNIISTCLTAYETAFQKKIKQTKLPRDCDVQNTHNTAVRQAGIHLKRAKMLGSYRQVYEKKFADELEASLQVMLTKNKISRQDFIENCSKRIVEKLKTQLNALFTSTGSRILYEDVEINPKVERLKKNLLSEFKDEFDDDDEPDLTVAFALLQKTFESVIESFLQQQKATAEFAKNEVNTFQTKLILRYSKNMQQIMNKNSFMDADTLTRLHKMNYTSIMKQLTTESSKGLSVDEIRLELENALQNAYSEIQKQQQVNFKKKIEEAENSIKSEITDFSSALISKMETVIEKSELEDFYAKEIAAVVVRFNQLYPFPTSSHEGKQLCKNLKESLEAEYQSQLKNHLRKLEENQREKEEKCIRLYRAEMKTYQANSDFLLEEVLLEAHQVLLNKALEMYNESQKNPVSDVDTFKRKLQAEFTTTKFQNLKSLELARSTAETWMTESLKDYDAQMKHFNSSCQNENDFRTAHNQTKDIVLSSFSRKWNHNNALRQQYEKKLVELMEQIFSELAELFGLRMDTGKVSAGDSKEEVRRYYHEEMKKHFENNHFIQPEELKAFHKTAVKAAISVCKKKKIVTESQKKALKQWLKDSFQKYKDLNDANLNWVDGTEPAIGIDLGTTFCCVAVLLHGKVKVIPNLRGKKTTPSYVTIHKDGSYVVGQAAKDTAYRHPENTAFDTKRIIGRQMDNEELQTDITYWPFNVKLGESAPAIDIFGKNYSPEEIASYLLKQLAQDAENMLGKAIKKAVITVPAYFTDGQRAATLDAGVLAGLEVLEIVNEPTAAAIAYKLERFHEDPRNVLIFDMGGGTFDVAVVKTDSTSIEVLNVDGDTHLGGEDFDRAMMHYCVGKFQEKHGIDPLRGKNSGQKAERDEAKQRLRRLQSNCEITKVQLSFTPIATISVDAFYKGIDFVLPFERETLERLIEPFLKEAIKIVDRVLRDANISKKNIDDIVLIGGSTRIPKVQEMISNYFDGKALNHTINPDEAVGYGAAVKAALLNGDQSKKMSEIEKIEDVTPRSLGIMAWKNNEEGKFSIIIPKSTKIPAKETRIFHTKLDNQEAVEIKIYQGEKIMADDNEYLGEFTLSGIPPAPAGKETLEVCMRVNNMGIVHVTATCTSTNGSETLIVSEKKGRLSEETKQRILNDNKPTKKGKKPSEMSTQQHQKSHKKTKIWKKWGL